MISLTLWGSTPGNIGICFNFRCGVCSNYTDFFCRNITQAKRQARRNGWQLRRELGWVCPVCLHSETCPECQPGNECRVAYSMRH